MAILFPKGSEWRKWDLHVHTPYSMEQHYGDGDDGQVWEKYISDLESLSSDFKVLGINDYLFIDGYERLLKEKNENGRLANIDLLLPVVEFRISKFSGVDFGGLKRINLIEEHGSITQREYGDISSRSLASRKLDFDKLVKLNLIEAKGTQDAELTM